MEMDEIKKKVLENVDPAVKKAKRVRRVKMFFMTLLEFAAIVFIVGVLFYIAYGVSKVDGDSMYPTLHDKDMIIYSRLEKDFKRGDIIAIDMGNGEGFVKRVAAVAGDTVNISEGIVYVNGREWKVEKAMGETVTFKGKVEYPVILQENEVFVIGDNRENSEDSRIFGPIQTDSIKGRLLWYIGTAE